MSTELLTIRDAAKRITLSEWTLRKWVANGKLPYVKLGRRVAIEVDTIERLIQQGRIEASEGNGHE